MTTEIALVVCVLAVTIVFFITELFRVDVIAIIIMLALPWLGLVIFLSLIYVLITIPSRKARQAGQGEQPAAEV